ncbi:HK97 gp10 family phage protein, partial [Acinetobacter baumannii]
FETMPERLRDELKVGIGRAVLKLQREVVQNKLSGQVLNVRTGNLRRSIDQVVTTEGSAVIGIVSTNVKYGRIHEYGFS